MKFAQFKKSLFESWQKCVQAIRRFLGIFVDGNGQTGGKGSIRSILSVRSTLSIGSIRSILSTGSILSIGSTGSILSIGSAGSILSIGSAGSILSIGSAGSILSIGSIGNIGNIGNIRSIGDIHVDIKKLINIAILTPIKISNMKKVGTHIRGLAHFSLVLLLVFLITIQPLYPILGGRVLPPPPTEEDIWIYANNKPTRTLGFFAFENLSEDESFASLRSSIPRAIAESLKQVQRLRLPPEDYIPVRENVDNYQLYTYEFADVEELFDYNAYLKDPQGIFPFTEAGYALQSNLEDIIIFEPPPEEDAAQFDNFLERVSQQFEEGLTNAPGDELEEELQEYEEGAEDLPPLPSSEPSPQAEDGTTSEDPLNIVSPQDDEVASDEEEIEVELSPSEQFTVHVTSSMFAYLIRQDELNQYLVYHFRETPSRYIDANLLDKAEREALPIPTITLPEDNLPYFYLDTHREKFFSVEPKLYFLNGVPLVEALDQVEADYMLYGTYETEGIAVSISIYLIYRHEKKIVHIYRETLKSFLIGNVLDDFSAQLIAHLEQRETVNNTRIEANEEGTFFSLDGNVLGELPLTLFTLVESDYQYEVFKPGYVTRSVESQLPLDEDTFIAERSDETIRFDLEQTATVGDLFVRVDNNVPVNIYVDEELKAVGQTNFFLTGLLPKDYYVLVEDEDEVQRNFQIPILPETITRLSFSALPAGSTPSKRSRSKGINYNLSARISAVFGFTLLSAFFLHRFQTVNLEDRIEGVDVAIRELEESTSASTEDLVAYRDELDEQRIQSANIDLYLILSTLTAFITMTVFHTKDIRRARSPIETKISSKGDVSISYVRKLGPIPDEDR